MKKKSEKPKKKKLDLPTVSELVGAKDVKDLPSVSELVGLKKQKKGKKKNV